MKIIISVTRRDQEGIKFKAREPYIVDGDAEGIIKQTIAELGLLLMEKAENKFQMIVEKIEN